MINFLQFDDARWNKYAGNRYMYMNRLRVDEIEDLFRAAHQRILASQRDVSLPALELLRTGEFKLDARFLGKSDEVLATTASCIVAEPCKAGTPAADSPEEE